MILTSARLAALLAAASVTRDDEIGCDDCAGELHRFAEATLAGRDAAEALPLVEYHLAICPACHDEFEALLEGLRALAAASRPWWAVGRS